LAYVFAAHEDQSFVKLKSLLEPFGITQFYPDGWGAYERLPNPAEHTVGKRNIQKIERKHLTFRTRIKRLARKMICFSKSIVMHDVVIGLFIIALSSVVAFNSNPTDLEYNFILIGGVIRLPAD
jgi:insertion element IS1 protein InsB